MIICRDVYLGACMCSIVPLLCSRIFFYKTVTCTADALLAADTLPIEPDEDQNKDEEMQEAVAEPTVAPQEQPASHDAHPGPHQLQEQPASQPRASSPHQAQKQPAPAARPPANPSGLARRRRR